MTLLTLFKKEAAPPALASKPPSPAEGDMHNKKKSHANGGRMLVLPPLHPTTPPNHTTPQPQPQPNHTTKDNQRKHATTVTKNGTRFSDATKAKTEAKPYHWQSHATKKATVDDMVLLTKISEAAITDNLKKRFAEDRIYTYIGPVLVAVNPFKQLGCFGEDDVRRYQGASHYEVPPHSYAVADTMYRNLGVDKESQCVIISGESGAGKTVSAKLIMNYITRISGGGAKVAKVKEVIMGSNPLLEAFGNARTIRNNNSSRFGKYIEIQFSSGGVPLGGKVSNFLLEKSRVHFLNHGERNFHIFYQLCSTRDESLQSELGLTKLDYYNYLNQSGVYKVEGTDDAKEFEDTIKAMEVMGLDEARRLDILRVVSAILHLGNITFVEQDNEGRIEDLNFLEYPSYLLGIDREPLRQKLTSRVFDSRWGAVSERVDVPLNLQQTAFARDAWAKGLYARLFDYIVKTVNSAMETSPGSVALGILDIYGFEIFAKNGFEQFCINYVNEKLQQIFIELTLKNEQEEYTEEGIEWKPIDFFNNKVVCELIESRRPPGVFSILDDTVATMSAVSEGADEDFRNKLKAQVGNNRHYNSFNSGFTIKHYAGKVDYHIEGFCEKNRDVLFVDIIQVMQGSSNPFVRSLFADDVSSGARGRPSTVAAKIRTQANDLVERLSAAVPHYLRCIKPNETKKPGDWDNDMVTNQVEYLGLKENVKVKRAGFAYRRPFAKFLQRYAILAPSGTLPEGDPKGAIHAIARALGMDRSQYQLGITKCFIKDPESVYMLEEFRERKFDHHARIIQRAFRKYFRKQRTLAEKNEASDVLRKLKERRAHSLNRNFFGDYVGVDLKPGVARLFPKRDKVEFAQTVVKYARRFQPCQRILVLTWESLYLIGLAKVKKGPQKGQIIEVIKRKIDLKDLVQVTLSTLADDFLLLQERGSFELLLEVTFKTELLMRLNRAMLNAFNKMLKTVFVNSFEYKVKKTLFSGAGSRRVEFQKGANPGAAAAAAASGNTLTVRIGAHLPAGTRPFHREVGSTRPANKAPNSTRAANGTQISDAFKQTGGYRVPTANQRWPPNAQHGTHMVPPPPNHPPPMDQPVVSPKPPILIPKPKINQVRALYNYDARDIDELTFGEGTILELVKQDDSGWWTCRLNSREGFCPGNYLEKL